MTYNSSIARILSLLRLLGDPTAAHDIESLAAHFETSIRTIRRDLKELKHHGIPVLETTGLKNHKTYSLDRTQLPPLRLTFEEALAIFLGQSKLTAFDGSGIEEAATSAYEKLRLTLGESQAKYVDKLLHRIHIANQPGILDRNREIIDSIFVAIEDGRVLFVEYQSARSTEPLSYDIHPYGMAEHRGSLYVVGYSSHHGETRTWKVDRIREAEATLLRFNRPDDFDIGKYFEGAFAIVTGSERQVVRIRFTGTAVRYVGEKQFHPSQTLHPQPDGSLILELRLSSLLEVQAWILSFGSSAQALEPAQLRQALAEESARMLRHYADAEHGPESGSNQLNHVNEAS